MDDSKDTTNVQISSSDSSSEEEADVTQTTGVTPNTGKDAPVDNGLDNQDPGITAPVLPTKTLGPKSAPKAKMAPPERKRVLSPKKQKKTGRKNGGRT